MAYPGFSLKDFFSRPAVRIPVSQLVTDDLVTWHQNQWGYRTMEFDQVPQDYFVVVGCSLTEGQGLEYNETWSYFLAQDLDLAVVNLAKGGANSQFCKQNIQQWIPQTHNPRFVVAQWPNPFRLLTWRQNQASFAMNSQRDEIYNTFLKHGDLNFYTAWMSSIIDAKRHCQLHSVPMINICLESLDFFPEAVLETLRQQNIVLHVDEKLPGRTWHFDSSARDQQHHSAHCTKKWAERILPLIQEFC